VIQLARSPGERQPGDAVTRERHVQRFAARCASIAPYAYTRRAQYRARHAARRLPLFSPPSCCSSRRRRHLPDMAPAIAFCKPQSTPRAYAPWLLCPSSDAR